MRPVFEWQIGSRALQLGRRTLIMGVVNVTPDSFSDGGLHLDPEVAVRDALQLLADGAHIIDIGGESTRPGAKVASVAGSSSRAGQAAVSEQEELHRVIPVITSLRQKHSTAIISIDTYKAAVARAAVEAGAEIVNDVSGFRWDSQMAKTLAELKCGAVLMHMRGRPEEWRTLPPSPDIVAEVKADLLEWTKAAMSNGIEKSRMVVDPGFGFGKKFEGNYPLLAALGNLHALGFPLLSGTSRKSFIGRTLARGDKDAPPEQRLYGTLATVTASVLQGAHIVRVHDVKAAVEAVKVADEILANRPDE